MAHEESADVAAIREVSAAWRDSVVRGDADAYLALLADEVEEIQPGAEPLVGAAFPESVRAFFAGYDVEMPPLSGVEIVVSGVLAYHRYTYEWVLTPKGGGEPVSERAHGLHILRRQPDGSWKITKDVYANVFSR
jgi:ketosteroid isomerase-like protein